MERQTLCSRVHDHYSDAAVCIPESSSFQERTAAGSGDTLSPGRMKASNCWKAASGSTKTQGCVSKGCAMSVKSKVSVAVMRKWVLSAVVYTVAFRLVMGVAGCPASWLEPVLGWHAPRKAAAMMTMYFFIIG